MPCDNLAAFADGELKELDADAFRAHLSGCERCQRGLIDYMEMVARLETAARASGRAYIGCLRHLILLIVLLAACSNDHPQAPMLVNDSCAAWLDVREDAVTITAWLECSAELPVRVELWTDVPDIDPDQAGQEELGGYYGDRVPCRSLVSAIWPRHGRAVIRAHAWARDPNLPNWPQPMVCQVFDVR